ncbi:MAG: NAD-dependent deacylase [Gemmatimonadota bacterium]
MSGAEGRRRLEQAAAILLKSSRVVAATGAGMSSESGIPTFRDALEGLWAHYDPEQLATRSGFQSNPARVWGWYNYRRGLISSAEPHPGHHALARLETILPDVVVVTQNIDGLHLRAGSSTVLELHGNINRFKCFDLDHPAAVELPVAPDDGPLEPPPCPECGSPLRPDVVWFGEMLPPGVFERAERHAAACEVMLVIGTSGLVYPAAGLPAVARATGASVIEVNTAPSDLTFSGSVDIFLEGPAGELIPELVQRMEAASR